MSASAVVESVKLCGRLHRVHLLEDAKPVKGELRGDVRVVLLVQLLGAFQESVKVVVRDAFLCGVARCFTESTTADQRALTQ